METGIYPLTKTGEQNIDEGRLLLVEEKETIVGSTRTRKLTLPGFRHDVCSAPEQV